MSTAHYLAEHRLFRGLAPEQIALIARCAGDAEFGPEEKIFRQGTAAERCYLIREGRVSVELASPERRAVSVQTLGAGEVLGWSWLFAPHRWHFDARAVEPTRAITLDGEGVRASCEQDHELGYRLMYQAATMLHERMQAARLQSLDLYGAKAD